MIPGPPCWVDFTILIKHKPSWQLVIYSEVIMSSFNHSLTDSLTLSTQQLGQEASSPTALQGLEGIASNSLWWSHEGLYKGLFLSSPPKEILIFQSRQGFKHQRVDFQPNSKQATGPHHYMLKAKLLTYILYNSHEISIDIFQCEAVNNKINFCSL